MAADEDEVRSQSNGTWTIPDLQIKIPGVAFTGAVSCTGEGAGGVKTGCQIPWIWQYVVGVYNYAINIVGLVAVVVMMIGGFIWITAGGNTARVGEAKNYIGASLMGLLIALASYTILYYINPNITKYTPIVIDQIKEGDPFVRASGGGTNTVTANKNAYDSLLAQAGKENNIDCTFLKAFMMTESSGNPNAVSPVGAIGLMQLMPNTAKSLGFNASDMKDPAKNIQAGSKYIKQLLRSACNGKLSNSVCNTSESSLKYVIASYNGGPGANKESTTCPGQTWWECEKNAGYAETRNYVNKVLNNYNKLQSSGWGCQ
jgi:hypothetical protein